MPYGDIDLGQHWGSEVTEHLTHCGLLSLCGDTDLGAGNGLLPGGTKAITWTNVDLSSVRSKHNDE